MQSALDQHIVMNPSILGGKPCIAGRRISVEHVVIWHLGEKLPIQEIAKKHGLTPASIHAALTYYYDHQEEIDQKVANDDAAYDEMRKAAASKLDSGGR